MNRVKEQLLIEWKELEWLQSKELKTISDESFSKLKESLKQNGFIQPFNVWFDEEEGKWFILDGHHRRKAMLELEAEGTSIDRLLPANVINCKDRKEAIKFLLLYSSEYAHTTSSGLENWLSEENIDITEFEGEIDIEPVEIEFDEPEQVKETLPEEEPEVKIVSLKFGDVVKIENKFLSWEFVFENKEGKELEEMQGAVFFNAIKALSKAMKKAKLFLNDVEVKIADLEGV